MRRWCSHGSSTSRVSIGDRVNEQVVKDPRIANMDPKSMPFDSKRMFWGGFKVFVEV